MIDIAAYLDRIGLVGPIEPTHVSLRALHEAHVGAIPFENVDVRLRRGVALDLASLEAKLVRRRRGGYCFEQNTLFAAVLRTLGFRVTTLEARVRPPGADTPLPRTHMTLRVGVEGRDYLADVGFGGSGPILPVPLDGTASVQPGGVYAVEREDDDLLALRSRWRGAWRDLYAFSLTPAFPVDYEVANHFTSTFPTSPFVTTLTVQRSDAAGCHILRGRTYTSRIDDVETVREIEDGELHGLLRDTFRLDISCEEALLALRGSA